MLPIQYILGITAAHWLFDFVLQSNKMALGKSKSLYWLTLHVLVYAAGMTGASIIAFGLVKGLFFGAFTFATHWIVDYYTSRLSAPLFAKQDYHNGWVVVGADQWLHLACLMTSYLMFK